MKDSGNFNFSSKAVPVDPSVYVGGATATLRHVPDARAIYMISKRIFDIAVCMIAIPMFLAICCITLLMNPIGNRGSLFFMQTRVGRDGRDFTLIKFRTMRSAKTMARGADDPLETSRITPLGSWMRATKFDEIPQILNVLRGDMSIVGPRPEFSGFVETFRLAFPNYTDRWSVRPGMTGYAQVIQGYTDSIEMVRQKTELDRIYIAKMSWKMDLLIIAKTFRVVTRASSSR